MGNERELKLLPLQEINRNELLSRLVQNGYKGHAVIYGFDCNRAYKLDLLKLTLRERYDKALEMLRSGTQTIQQISNATGIREVDVIKLKRNLNEQTVSFLGNSNDDSSMSY